MVLKTKYISNLAFCILFSKNIVVFLMMNATINNMLGVAVLHVVNVTRHNEQILVKIMC
jgi:hypothetical protein